MTKMYDSLMKAGSFTAAQNKAENKDFVDSVGELIEMCEKQGYIEKYYRDKPNDKIDFAIQDMQRYMRNLVEKETNLNMMIEKAIKENEKEDEDNRLNDETEIVDEDNMTIKDIEKSIITDQDYSDFEDFLEEETAQSEKETEGDAN